MSVDSVRQGNTARRGQMWGVIGVSALALAGAVRSSGAATYQVESYLYENVGPPNTEFDLKDTRETGQTEASTTASYDPSSNTSQERVDLNSYAAGEGVSAHVEADANYSRAAARSNSTQSFVQLNSSAQTIITINDLVISGPTAVATKINFHLDGSVQAGSTSYGGTDVSGQATFIAYVIANGKEIGTGQYSETTDNGVITNGPVGGGWLAGFTGNNVVTTDSITLPVNTPITLTINVSMLANAAMTDDSSGNVQTIADFGNTFSFATDRPVFNLPAGYSADSVSSGLVANAYVAPTPEPGTLGLSGVAALGLLRRRGRTGH